MMEAASRPVLEPLSELPIEAPLDAGGVATRAEPGSTAAPAGSRGSPRDDLINPDDLLSAGAAPTAAPSAAPSGPAPASVAPEAELQDLALLAADELPPLEAITPPAPRPTPAPAEPAPTGRAAAKASAPGNDHTKLRGALRLASAPPPPKGQTDTTRAPSATAGPRGSPASARASQPKSAAGSAPGHGGDKAPMLAPAAARPVSTLPVLSPQPASAPVAPAPGTPTGPASASSLGAPAASATAGAPAGAPMDRDFIVRNQIVERYLSGRLPLKGASDFERFCREQPEYLDEIGLSDRVNAGLRLLEAGGKPEPWQEAPRPFWQKPQVPLVLGALVAVLGIALAIVANQSAGRGHQIERLRTQATERPLDPATSTREIRLLPSREGASNNPAIVIGGGPAQLIDLKIDESRSVYKVFRVTIDRIDQGRVAVLGNLLKDSNGHLRIALNSSALGPGNYQFTIEGLTWRGEPEPDSWITLGVQH